jgi:hypothetical protein
MIPARRVLAVGLAALFLLKFTPYSSACGPSSIEPIFVFSESPDLPFLEFTKGKIGIVQPTFGRKTLVTAYRYLNGGSFDSDEQNALVEALRGKPPEDDGASAIKEWIAARNDLPNHGKLPEIYLERQYGGYDFFPNCTRNGFEVATQTLRERAATYGSDNKSVDEWLAAQDSVFKNCAGGASLPDEIGSEKPMWLRKDRDYQIGAALLYSLNFDRARARFQNIAADNESPWQETADYLVARTLVRQASLTQNETRRRELLEQAEVHLQMLLRKGGKLFNASHRLLGLVKYRLHPEERVLELAHILTAESGNENVRQDLIDYVWLLDKFEAQIFEQEHKRKEALKPPEEREKPNDWFMSKEAKERYEAVHRGELIEVRIYLKKADGTPDYSSHGIGFDFKSDTSEAEIFQAFEMELGRKLTPEEAKDISERHKSALSYREWMVSPNRKWSREYEGDHYDGEKLTLAFVPQFFRSDDLSDWIFTLQTADPGAYLHAFKKWRETGSQAWLLSALTKAERSSPSVERLMRAAEKVDREAPAFATVAFHMIRLKVDSGEKAEARKLLDEIISSQSELLPVSTRNQFSEQRMQLAEDLEVFLKSGLRKPVTFYNEGRFGSLTDFLEAARHYPNAEDSQQTKEDYERGLEDSFKELLPWNDRLSFDKKTTEVFNAHFSLTELLRAAHSAALPSYMKRRLVLAIWTRAVLLKNQPIANRVAPEVIKVAPEMSTVFLPYLKAASASEKQHAALYVLLKFPALSPLVAGGLPNFVSSEELDYYFETSWWCTPSDTDYNNQGVEVPKIVAEPEFLTRGQLAEAKRERAALIAVGDAKSYLGKQVIEWARNSGGDQRLPEALFIAVRANSQYKYGCDSWSFDQKTKQDAEAILRKRYPGSAWTAKLNDYRN